MARAQWIALEQLNTLPDSELRELLTESYRLVFERLPKKRQQELQGGAKTAQRKTGGGLREKEKPAVKKEARSPVVKTKRKSLTSKKKSAKAGRRG